MSPSAPVGFPNLERFENNHFTLLFYLNYVKKVDTKGYYCRALFKSDTGMYLIEEIPLELIILYPSNHRYVVRQIGRLEKKKNKNIETKLILNIPEEQEIVKLKDVFKDKEEYFTHSFESPKGKKNFTNEILNQFCFISDDLLIPWQIIASKFYFTSSRIVPHILNNTLENTYENITRINENKFKIQLKFGFSNVDSKRIIFFTIDDYAKKTLKMLSNYYIKLINSDTLYFSLPVRFPFFGKFNVVIGYEQVDNFKLVHRIEILDKDKLPWNSYNVSVARVKKISLDNSDSEQIKERTIPQILTEDTEGILSQDFPKKYIKTAGIRVNLEKEDSTDTIESKIIKEKSTIRYKLIYRSIHKETEEISQQKQVKEEDDKQIIPVEFQRDDKVTPIEDFGLEQFIKLIGLLKSLYNIDATVRIFLVPEVTDGSINEIEYYDIKGKLRRKCAKVDFEWQGKYVFIFELDQKGFKIGTSTFVFVSKRKLDYKTQLAVIKEFLSGYIKGLYKDQLIYQIYSKFKVSLIYKKHPVKHKIYQGWCLSLINKIDSV